MLKRFQYRHALAAAVNTGACVCYADRCDWYS
jgi:hypothetical protein